MTSNSAAPGPRARSLPPVLAAGVLVGVVVVLAELLDGDDVGLSVGVVVSGVLVGAVVALVLLPGRLRRARREEDAAQPLHGLDPRSRDVAVRACRRGPAPDDQATRLAALRVVRARLADRSEHVAWSRGVTGAAAVGALVLGLWPVAVVLSLVLGADELGRVRLARRVRTLGGAR